jgi:hypothetical protein
MMHPDTIQAASVNVRKFLEELKFGAAIALALRAARGQVNAACAAEFATIIIVAREFGEW